MLRLIKFSFLYAVAWAYVLWLIFPGNAEAAGRAVTRTVTVTRSPFAVNRSFGFGHHAGAFLPSRGFSYRAFGFGHHYQAAPLLLYTPPAALYYQQVPLYYPQQVVPAPAAAPAPEPGCACAPPAPAAYLPAAPVAAPVVGYSSAFALPARELAYLRTLDNAQRVQFLEFRHGRAFGQRLFFQHFGRGRQVQVTRVRDVTRGPLLPGRQRTVTRQVIRTR